MEDLYYTLGVASDAGYAEIKSAYRSKVMQLHPDHNPNDPTAHTRMVDLTQAYKVLSTPSSRTEYDDSRLNFVLPLACSRPQLATRRTVNNSILVQNLASFRWGNKARAYPGSLALA